MWQAIADHAGSILTLLGAAIGLVGMWTKMGMKLTVIEKDVLENRSEMRSGFERTNAKLISDVAACKIEHAPCYLATIEHHTNAAIHLQPDRWADVANRLTRIESLLMHIRDNGK